MDNATKKLFEKYPEMKDVVFAPHPPTARQMRYAYNLGINLNGASFESISADIDKAVASNVKPADKMSYTDAYSIHNYITEQNWKKEWERTLTYNERIGWLYYFHILLPEDTKVKYLENLESYLLNLDKGFLCPNCNRYIWLWDGFQENCPKCSYSLKNIAWQVQFGPRGGVTVLPKTVTFELEFLDGFDIEKFKPGFLKDAEEALVISTKSENNKTDGDKLPEQSNIGKTSPSSMTSPQPNNANAGCGCLILIVCILAVYLFYKMITQ